MKQIKSLFNIFKSSITIIMFILGLALGMYGFDQYWSGYHDLDMAQNMIFLKSDIQFELWENKIPYTLGQYAETTTNRFVISPERLYYNGVLRLKSSIPFLLLGFFTAGYYLSRMEKQDV